MKKSILMLVLFLPFGVSCFAQTNYYNVNPRTGERTRVGYSEPVNTAPAYPSYTPQYNVNAYGNAMAARQAQYNANVQWIEQRINYIANAINDLSKDRPAEARQIRQDLDTYVQGLNSNHQDFADSEVMASVKRCFNILVDKINDTP